ncbi:MAG: acyl-CoA dehydrogenase family protein [Gammaproteobacteria bacterium]|nr:acyl-CoA dehydrogenase family protein [Gammaproteobacteria bacterium]
MAIDFTFPDEVEDARLLVKRFMGDVARPRMAELSSRRASGDEWRQAIKDLRQTARDQGLWVPHMPEEWGGMGLGVTAVAAMSAEAVKTNMGPYLINCQAPDEGNMHTLLHFGTDEQKDKWLKPLCEGTMRSCFSMTEPEVAGSDPTQIQTSAVRDGDEWVINGHKWFTSGAHGADFAIVIAKTDPDAEIAQARNSAFIVPTSTPGFDIVRDISTMGGGGGHPEIRYNDVRVPHANMLGEQGGGHKLGQVRLGPARLAHCMRWLGTIEQALEMLVDRAQKRYAHGSLLSEKQGIQWMMAESALELYSSKLMVLHAAYKIENGMDFRSEVSMAKHHVANTLWKTVDRALQVHGALGYSNDSPLAQMLIQARWSRIADGSDEVHLMRIAEMVMRSYNETGSVNHAVGDLPL